MASNYSVVIALSDDTMAALTGLTEALERLASELATPGNGIDEQTVKLIRDYVGNAFADACEKIAIGPPQTL